jgi:NTP pyrophosphatase (non-canonical NTP hydrolase)
MIIQHRNGETREVKILEHHRPLALVARDDGAFCMVDRDSLSVVSKGKTVSGAIDLIFELELVSDGSFHWYETLAQETNLVKGKPTQDRLLHAAVGLIGEAGEILDEVKKSVWYSKPLSIDLLVEEIGDALWYLTDLVAALNLHLINVAWANILKLRKRHADNDHYKEVS